MQESHSLLRRQLRRHGIDIVEAEPRLRRLAGDVDEAYRQFDSDRRMLERSLELSSNELMQANTSMRAVFSALPDIFFWLDKDGTILNCRAGQESDLLFPPSRLIGRRFQDIRIGDLGEMLDQAIRSLREGQALVTVEYSLPIRGTRNHYEARFVLLQNDEILVNIRNITQHMLTEEALRKNEERFRSLVQNSSDVILLLDVYGRSTYISPSAERVLGINIGERLGMSAFSSIHPDDKARTEQAFRELMTRPGQVSEVEFRYLRPDGAWRHFHVVGSNRVSDPSVTGIVVNLRDITERKHFESQLMQQALFDPVTGLANRTLFSERLQFRLKQFSRRRAAMAVMFLDMDRFKLINDSLGHGAGDQLLAAYGARLQETVRSVDTVARFAGDEFTVLVDSVHSADHARRVGERVLDALRKPFLIDNRERFVTTSLGIAVTDTLETSPEDLLRNADAALYQAKALGKDRAVVFDSQMHRESLRRLNLETDLRRAIDEHELRLHYQPQIDMRSGRLIGVEALIRWQHPERGLVMPSDFIPIAEDNGVIVAIGRWVVEEAARQSIIWKDSMRPSQPLLISANLSAREFQDPGLIRRLMQVLEDANVDPTSIAFEITESALLGDSSNVRNAIHTLKQAGVRLAIDDFGTGYSSFNYLRRINADTLKIDRSFVHQIDRDDRQFSIVRSMSMLAHSLEMEVVAEGIETNGEAAAVAAAGCDRAQGYYFSRPVTPQRIGQLLGHNVSFPLHPDEIHALAG